MSGKGGHQAGERGGTGAVPNRLIDEVSPYLLQHAWNPVAWHPWGEHAFEKAAKEDKPVFLSIGYATCHWCHVMEHESFEDPEVAAVLNRLFVPVKVDREERPDIDSLYMMASQVLSGGGGWPLNLFLTPDKKPFFAMTYVPRERRFGNPGILDIFTDIGRMWREARPELLKAAGSVAASLARGQGRGGRIRRNVPDAGFDELLLRFDRTYGGFGPAPKFPLPHTLLFLLRYATLKGEGRATAMVEKTLRSMARGGIHDQLGGGFHRYSTDSQWLVPHFEKMLYDQALLALAYTEAFQVTHDTFYRDIARKCLDYVIREMIAPEGGFVSAKDADTGGEEGGYYLWTKQEIEELLDSDTAAAVTAAWHITTRGNFIDPVTGDRTGKNILHLAREVPDLAAKIGLSQEDLLGSLEMARTTLLAERNRRHPPLTDDKILTDWNGLMIGAFAKAAAAFNDTSYLDAATRAAGCILTALRKSDGTLLHRYRNGASGIAGMAPDYAFLVFGLTELYQAGFDPRYLALATELQEQLDTLFWDKRDGGYFTAAATETGLIARQKEFYDGAIPSPNSVAFTNLLRLSLLTGDVAYENRASDIAHLYTNLTGRSPAAYPFFLSGLCLLFGPFSEIVICEGPSGEPAERLTSALHSRYLPFAVLLLKNQGNAEELETSAPFTRDMMPAGGKTAAYVCSRHTCLAPVTDVDELLAELVNTGARR